jgi:hypothetical protein
VRAAAVARRRLADEQRAIAERLLLGRMHADDANRALAALYARPQPRAFNRRDMEHATSM